jgi:hypothetical protein
VPKGLRVRVSLDAPEFGDVAQLVVHLLCKQTVESSSLFFSTKELI